MSFIPINVKIDHEGKMYLAVAMLNNSQDGMWYWAATSGGKFEWVSADKATLSRGQV